MVRHDPHDVFVGGLAKEKSRIRELWILFGNVGCEVRKLR
jgi:hypothetical protein